MMTGAVATLGSITKQTHVFIDWIYPNQQRKGVDHTMLGVLDKVNGRGSCPDFVVMLSQSDSKPPPHPLNVPREYMYGRMDMRSEGMWKRDS